MTNTLRTTIATALSVAVALAMPAASWAQPTSASNTGVSSTRSAARKVSHANRGAKKSAKKTTDDAGQFANFAGWSEVNLFIDEMVAQHGFDRAALTELMGQVHYVVASIDLVKPGPPGKPKNWQAYRQRFIEPVRIDAGVAFWAQNADTLARAERDYGVPAEIIAGIIGVETLFGRNTGRFRVLDVLTTLALAYPEAPNRDARKAFFRSEMVNTLLFARQNGIDPLSVLGSYAGAVGLPQFMPGSILNFGVDYDGDGHIDLRGSPADAIGSVAHFLVEHGWQRGITGPAVYPALVAPSRAWEPLLGQGLEAKFRMEALLASGVSSDTPLPPALPFGLVDLQNGAEATEYWLATANFFAITQYNRSYFYAMSVIELGQAIRAARGL